MDKGIYRVENPVYLKKDEIQKKYWEKQVLLTNVEMTPDFSQMDGGIVRYYADNSMSELWELLSKLRETEGVDTIDCCSVEYVGPIYMNLSIPPLL